MKNLLLLTATAWCALLTAEVATASVVIAGTRVIYPQERRDVSVQLDNVGDLPALVQVWVDDNTALTQPEELDVPFVVVPPLFRIDPDKGQTVRVTYVGEQSSKKQESIYWLNVLDVPPQSEDMENENALQLAIKTRIKIFLRPVGLDAEGARAAANNLTWTLSSTEAGRAELVVKNKSPYNVILESYTIAGVDIAGEQSIGEVITPHGQSVFSFNRNSAPMARNSKIEYRTINDYGSSVKHDAHLQ